MRPQRVRVTAPGVRAAEGGVSTRSTSGGWAGEGLNSESGGAGSDEVYVRSLIRSQLRLAVVVASGFLVTLLAFSLTLRIVPALGSERWLGVPVAWLLLAFGVYPMIGLSAWLYVRMATRNESRYQALVEESA